MNNLTIKVYYQDFHLNALTFNETGLILDEANAVKIQTFTILQLQVVLAKMGRELPEGYTMTDLADAVFAIFNEKPTEVVYDTDVFKKVGHTSMSVGDYVTFVSHDFPDQEDVLICAQAGWKGISKCLDEWTKEKARLLESISKMPVDIINAMYLQLAAYGHDAVKERLLTFKDTKCENKCPKCFSEDITWATKDVQDSKVYQNATCNKCGCEFTEEYDYTRTVIDEVVK